MFMAPGLPLQQLWAGGLGGVISPLKMCLPSRLTLTYVQASVVESCGAIPQCSQSCLVGITDILVLLDFSSLKRFKQ